MLPMTGSLGRPHTVPLTVSVRDALQSLNSPRLLDVDRGYPTECYPLLPTLLTR